MFLVSSLFGLHDNSVYSGDYRNVTGDFQTLFYKRFSLYNVSAYVSQQSLIPNDAVSNILLSLRQKKADDFCDILPENAILLIATSSAFKYSTFEDTNERPQSDVKNKLM